MRAPRIGPLVLVGSVAACLVAVGLLSLSNQDFVLAGLRGADSVTTYGLTAIRVLSEITAVLCIGAILLVTLGGTTTMRAASWAAAGWCVAAMLSVPFTVADVFARSILDTLEPGRLLRIAFALEQTKAWLLTAGIALILVIATRRAASQRAARILLGLALFGIVPLAASGHSSSGGNHDWATSSLLVHLVAAALWVGGLIAVLVYARTKGDNLGVVVSRFSTLALVCWLTLAASGSINALIRLDQPGIYLQLVLAKIVLLLALGVFGYFQRQRGVRDVLTGRRHALLRLGAFEVLVMLVTIGVATALARTPPPGHGDTPPERVELMIGYLLPGPPTLSRFLADWRFDLILGTAAIAMAVVYLIRVRMPMLRTVAWLGGCAEILLATSSGIGRYAPAVFSIDMVSNILLAVLGPLLLAIGSPPSLARTFTAHPAVAAIAFAGVPFVLYFTGFYGWSLDVPLANVGINALFLVTGYVFFCTVFQSSWRTKQIMAFGAVGAYAVFGAILFGIDTVLGGSFYTQLGLPWIQDLAGVQRMGGAVVWGLGAVPLLFVAFASVMDRDRTNSRTAVPAGTP